MGQSSLRQISRQIHDMQTKKTFAPWSFCLLLRLFVRLFKEASLLVLTGVLASSIWPSQFVHQNPYNINKQNEIDLQNKEAQMRWRSFFTTLTPFLHQHFVTSSRITHSLLSLQALSQVTLRISAPQHTLLQLGSGGIDKCLSGKLAVKQTYCNRSHHRALNEPQGICKMHIPAPVKTTNKQAIVE